MDQSFVQELKNIASMFRAKGELSRFWVSFSNPTTDGERQLIAEMNVGLKKINEAVKAMEEAIAHYERAQEVACSVGFELDGWPIGMKIRATA